MPYLKKPKRRARIVRKRSNRAERSKIYNTATWQRLRTAKLMDSPLCEICVQRGIITPATEVHHADGFLNYEGVEREAVAYDYRNLVSLCTACHLYLHRGNKQTHGLDRVVVAKEMDNQFGRRIRPGHAVMDRPGGKHH